MNSFCCCSSAASVRQQAKPSVTVMHSVAVNISIYFLVGHKYYCHSRSGTDVWFAFLIAEDVPDADASSDSNAAMGLLLVFFIPDMPAFPGMNEARLQKNIIM